MHYCVIEKKSVHHGQVGVLLDKGAVRQKWGNWGGRSDRWYAAWDVLLAFDPEDDFGVGFNWNELEPVP